MRAVYDADKFVWRFASAFRHYRKGEISAPDFIQAQRTDLAKFDARTQKPGPSSSGPSTKAPSATPAKAAKASTPVKNLAYVALPSGRPIVDTQNALGPAVIRRPKEGASQAAQRGTEAAVPPLADGQLAPSSKARQPLDSVVYARPRSSADSAAVPTAGDVETKKGRKEVKAKGEGKKGGNKTDATGMCPCPWRRASTPALLPPPLPHARPGVPSWLSVPTSELPLPRHHETRPTFLLCL